VRRQYVKSCIASAPHTDSSVSQTGGRLSRRARIRLQFSSRSRYSSHSSRLPLSDIFGEHSSPPGSCGASPRLNADTALRLVRTVLISPLWQVNRNGWASFQFGNVFVLYRRWKLVMPDSKPGAVRSG
jgi:hypothetical protein